MDSSGDENRVRQRAYEIWEREGRPGGKEEEHWHQANREIRDEGAAAGPISQTLTDTMGLVVGEEPTSSPSDPTPRPLQGDPAGDAGTGKARKAAKKPSR